MENTGNTITAFIIGVAVGAITGLLLAPETGEETRARISTKAEDLLQDIEEAWGISPEKIKEFRDTALAEIEKLKKKFSNSENV
ncbi:MAG: YtxH domain-containing protein [Bacteroidota bacterium]|nr:YtxH domain-containing protein [Bacteroidota bacterium]